MVNISALFLLLQLKWRLNRISFRWYAPYMELFRCILFLAVDLILSVQNLDTGGKLRHFFPIDRFFFPLFPHPFPYFKRAHMEN